MIYHCRRDDTSFFIRCSAEGGLCLQKQSLVGITYIIGTGTLANKIDTIGTFMDSFSVVKIGDYVPKTVHVVLHGKFSDETINIPMAGKRVLHVVR